MQARDLRKLPKADLHCHLEGCARPSTVLELAEKYAVKIDDLYNFYDLPTFLSTYKKTVVPVIRSVDDLMRIASELIEDRADSGAIYCEPMWTPHSYTALNGLSGESYHERSDEVFRAVNIAMQSAADARGIAFGHMIGVSKSHPESAVEYAKFAVLHKKDGVVSFGTYGNELLPHNVFAHGAQIAINGGLAFVPHAGEVRGAESVADVITQHPKRVSHGVRAIEDSTVVRSLIANDIACDVAISSNLALGVIGNLQLHPISKLLSAGVAVTISTDDSLFFKTTLLEEYKLARSMGLDDDMLAKIARNSIEFSALSEEKCKEAVLGIEKWLSDT